METDNFLEIFDLIESGLNNIEQGITIFDKDLVLVFANRRMEELLGIPSRLLKRGVTFQEMVVYNCEHGEYGPGDIQQQLDERVVKARQNQAHTIERTRPNDTVLRITGTPLKSGGFATIYTDITQDRLYEIKLEQLINEQTIDIRRGEERLRLIANEVPAGIAYLDQNDIFQFANRRFASAYRSDPDVVVGQHCQDVLSEDVYAVSERYFDMAKSGEKVDFDHKIILDDGRELDIRTYLRPDIGNDGKVSGFYVLSINVTRHKIAAAAFSQAQKMEAVGRLSSGIAHDFNNMLTVILGNLTPLSAYIQDESVQKEMLIPAIRAAKRGADLTKQLLTVARRQSLEPKPVNVSNIINNLADLVMSSLSDNTQLNIEVKKEDMWTFVDPSPLENTLLNLIFNARDAIQKKGTISVSLDCVKIDKWLRGEPLVDTDLVHYCPTEAVRIRIRDNGAGIPKEIIKKIFDPFFSTKAKENGSGLGLSMAQSFVEQSQGKIDVTSIINMGTTFTILLPKIKLLNDVVSPKKTPLIQRKTKALALVVDDNEDVRQVVRRDLVSIGFSVIEAENAREAYQLVEQVDAISAIVSDIDMPGKQSGIELIESIQVSHGHISTVLMTGHGEDNTNYISIKGCKVLRKPFSRESLSEAITFSENAKT